MLGDLLIEVNDHRGAWIPDRRRTVFQKLTKCNLQSLPYCDRLSSVLVKSLFYQFGRFFLLTTALVSMVSNPKAVDWPISIICSQQFFSCSFL